MEIIDISVPVRPGMPVYESDPPVRLERVAAIADGALYNLSRIDMGAHTGTHVDAPAHFIDGAAGVDALPLDALIGPAHVVDATASEAHIDGRALGLLALPDGAERLLFKTRNSELWARDGFTREFAGLTEDAARALVRRGVRLAGIDYLSIAPPDAPGPAHVALLEAGVVILEGLDLRGVEAGAYTLICLPLRLAGADGAPARAVLVRG